MKVIVDENIPYIKKALEAITDNVIYISGRNFTPELIKDADALIIRTRTYCNKSLLEGSKVQFIATATIGFDHIIQNIAKKPVLNGPMPRDAMLHQSHNTLNQL